MKRKKPPIALISFLVISLVGLVIVGPAFAFFNKSGEDQMKQLQQEAMERAKANASKPAENVNAKQEVGAMKDALKKESKPQTAPQKPMDPSEHGKATVPTVIMPSDEVRKPTPNSASPSSQWYGNK